MSGSNTRIYSLSDITASLKDVLYQVFPDQYWIVAEIAKLNRYTKTGHCYPDLIEKKDNVLITQMRGTIWSGYYTFINEKFKNDTGENLSDESPPPG